MIGAWLAGLVRARTATVLGTVAGIAITVGLIVALSAFMALSAAEMTARATDNVPIDWQVELVPGASIDNVVEDMRSAARIVRTAIVGYATSDGFEASGGGTVQVTGAGKSSASNRPMPVIFPAMSALFWGSPKEC
jgi:putative ABC transport system permease protein